jgi:shikimate kinase
VGLSIPEIFSARGELEFRALEQRCIARQSSLTGAVIATGGGAVLCPENMHALRRNGHLVYLDCALEALEREGRPLSSNRHALTALYQARHALYQRYADARISRCATVEATAQALEKEYHEAVGR